MSNYAITGILSIGCSDGKLCPVAFYFCTLTSSELNYKTHDKELLTILEAFQHWWYCLEGSASSIDIMTSHKNLKYFSSSKHSPGSKPVGQSSFVSLTSLSAFTLDALVQSPMLSPTTVMFTQKRGIISKLLFVVQSLQDASDTSVVQVVQVVQMVQVLQSPTDYYSMF